MTIMYVSDDYDRALARAKRAEDTSNLDSEADDPPTKRSRKTPQRLDDVAYDGNDGINLISNSSLIYFILKHTCLA